MYRMATLQDSKRPVPVARGRVFSRDVVFFFFFFFFFGGGGGGGGGGIA